MPTIDKDSEKFFRDSPCLAIPVVADAFFF